MLDADLHLTETPVQRHSAANPQRRKSGSNKTNNHVPLKPLFSQRANHCRGNIRRYLLKLKKY
jgi:hypothetical protein